MVRSVSIRKTMHMTIRKKALLYSLVSCFGIRQLLRLLESSSRWCGQLIDEDPGDMTTKIAISIMISNILD
jgi:hypothetical protein